MRKRKNYSQKYALGVRWIADNDNAGSDDALDVIEVAGYISTLLLADLFNLEPEAVALDIVNARRFTR